MSHRPHSLAALVLALSTTLAGCAYPRLAQAPPPSVSRSASARTRLGQEFADEFAQHAGLTGLYVLSSGYDAFAARVALIDRAEVAIDLQVYILHDDVTGRWILSRLLAAADRGVRVRLLVDDLGSVGIDDLLAAADVQPGLEVRLYNPFARGPLPGLARMLDMAGRFSRLNQRMHNKLLAVDGVAAVVGGRNVGDEYFDAHGEVNFADLDLLAAGPVVDQLGQGFDLYWNNVNAVPLSAWRSLRRDEDDLATLREELAAHEREHTDSVYAERVRSSSLVQEAASGALQLVWAPTHAVADLPRKTTARGDELSATLLTSRLGSLWPPSSTELDIVSPYFVPMASGAEHLLALVRRGVRVRVLTNALAATDVAAVHAGYKAYRRELVEGGVEVYELRASSAAVVESERKGLFGSSSASLHAKTYMSDGRRLFVGSLNLDPRSVALNTELGLVVDSPELAARQREVFERMIAPRVSWRVLVDADGRLTWEGEEEGRTVRLHQEPDTGWWQRFKVSLVGLLPIHGQL